MSKRIPASNAFLTSCIHCYPPPNPSPPISLYLLHWLVNENRKEISRFIFSYSTPPFSIPQNQSHSILTEAVSIRAKTKMYWSEKMVRCVYFRNSFAIILSLHWWKSSPNKTSIWKTVCFYIQFAIELSYFIAYWFYPYQYQFHITMISNSYNQDMRC